MKYPCEAKGIDKKFKHRKKYGFFQAEKHAVIEIAEKLGMPREEGDIISFKRHPFVYLVEAADDICYRIIDMEDAQRLGLLSHEVVSGSFLHIIKCINHPGETVEKAMSTYNKIGDPNEKISYLRAKVINILIQRCVEVFWENSNQILGGTFNDTLLDLAGSECGAFDEVMRISAEKIYNHETVLEIEIAGYNVMSELLSLFVPALLKQKPDHMDEKVLKLFPMQFREFETTDIPYEKVLNAFDLISGMTDLYATEMFKKLKGIDTPRHG